MSNINTDGPRLTRRASLGTLRNSSNTGQPVIRRTKSFSGAIESTAPSASSA